MAGQPWKMTEKVGAFTSRAYNFAEDLRELMPQQYHDRPNPNDPIGTAWREAMSAAADNYRAISALESRLVVTAIKADEAKQAKI